MVGLPRFELGTVDALASADTHIWGALELDIFWI
jgi:hypothetical protein